MEIDITTESYKKLEQRGYSLHDLCVSNAGNILCQIKCPCGASEEFFMAFNSIEKNGNKLDIAKKMLESFSSLMPDFHRHATSKQ